ncbi:dynamin [Anaeramoeba flamelloides]|uniref:Dynamin n=1 Tax=Anaeramoeba flamelloides TaxID=1746091 RepID=A0ABQ8XK63_9EUKA|nr:dynamin [Anaeramoeba flamelloides]
MNKLIPLVNKLRQILNQAGSSRVLLPSIVVVGEQSAGKSSVLENIVGKDFLPRGDDIVTRRPLVLQLSTIPSNQTTYAYFGSDENTTFPNLKGVKSEIKRRTKQVTRGKNISPDEIMLNVFSNDVPELTLIDLPGLTQVAVEGQDKDISQQIRKLVLKYIQNPKSIILAIIPANQDLANSAALRIAREVDPEGKRTLGVLTKVDIIQKGVNINDILEGRLYPLKLGYIPIMNRSNQSIKNKKTIKTALREEREFFRNNYNSYKKRCGTVFLCKRLSLLLVSHIKKDIHEIRDRVQMKIKQTEKKQKDHQRKYGTFISSKNQAGVLMHKLNIYANTYIERIEGSNKQFEKNKLTGGARINYLFTNIFRKFLNEFDPIKLIDLQRLITEIRKSKGLNFNTQISDETFKKILSEQILLLEQPCQQVVELTAKELKSIVKNLEILEIKPYPKLEKRLSQLTLSLIEGLKNKTKTFVNKLISVEADVVTLSHPDYIRPDRENIYNLVELSLQKKRNVKEKYKSKPKTKNNKPNKNKPWYSFLMNAEDKIDNSTNDNNIQQNEVQYNHLQEVNFNQRSSNVFGIQEKVDLIFILQSLSNYLQIIKIKISDLIPKAIGHFLINKSKQQILGIFVTNLYQKQNFNVLLAQNEQVENERIRIQNELSIFYQAMEYLKNSKSFKF